MKVVREWPRMRTPRWPKTMSLAPDPSRAELHQPAPPPRLPEFLAAWTLPPIAPRSTGMCLVVDFVLVIVEQVAFPFEGVKRRSFVLHVEVVVDASSRVVTSPDAGIRAADVAHGGAIGGVRKAVDTWPSTPCVVPYRSFREGEPSGHVVHDPNRLQFLNAFS